MKKNSSHIDKESMVLYKYLHDTTLLFVSHRLMLATIASTAQKKDMGMAKPQTEVQGFDMPTLCNSLYNLKSYTKGMGLLIPICSEHDKAPYLYCRTHMLADARTDVVVADAHKAYLLRHILWQTVYPNAFRHVVDVNILVDDGQVFCNEVVHARLYLLLFLTRRLMVEREAHLAFLAFDVRIIGASTPKHPHHGLVQEMLCRMCRRKLVLVMFIQFKIVVDHILIFYVELQHYASVARYMESHIAIRLHRHGMAVTCQ